ncbi:MAG TPA: PEGA domain-containing protein [Verrucomicrobiae bacterium]|nr:PEGA domain-containing protein [Verrucomicrobiae bacterium]
MQENTTTTTAATATAPRTDRLELVKELTRGSIGTVHKARSPQLERSMTLRQFQVPEWLDDVNELMQRILAEARAASALDQANIAHLYTCGYKDFNVFMTAEFVEGQTLKEVMGARIPDLNEILPWAKQLCAAVDYANDKAVYHHFLNPYNIKVTADGTLKVLDFGLIRDKNLLTPTPAKKLEDAPYLSPEQVKNRIADRATNIFNIGVILYELYTTRSPFAGNHLGEVDRAIADANPHPLNVANGRVPESISRVVLKAMAKNPVERYESGAQLIMALESAMREPRVAPAKPATGKFSAGDATGSFKANATGSFKANATGSFNANATGSFNPNATGSFRRDATGSFSANKTGAFSRDAFNAALQNGAPASAPTTKARIPNPSTAPVARKTVGSSSNQWVLVGGVVAILVILAAGAMLLQRKPADLPSDNETVQTVPSHAPAPAPFTQPQTAPAQTNDQPAEAASINEPARSSRGNSPRYSRTARPSRNYSQPAPAAPAQGQLEVSAFPLGAMVQIQGVQGVWKSPQVIGPLAAGTYQVTISSPGYASETRSIQITQGARVPLSVNLTASKGFIKVAGSPAGASILLDGKDTGKVTPAELPVDPGPHSVTVRKQGYLDSSTELKLAAGQGTTYSPRLMVAGRTDDIRIVGGGMGKVFGGGSSSSGMARIEIKSEPKGAQVVVNGTPLQKLTPLEIQVDAGSYDITLQKDGYKPVHESAIVGMDDHIKIDRSLTH